MTITLYNGSDASISESPSAAGTSSFRFNGEMDKLWTNCEWLAGGTYLNAQVDRLPGRSSTLIKPLHLALGLLFDGLHDDEDPWLYATEPELPRSLQLPLFWTAISQASGIPDDIASHIHEVMFKPHGKWLLQQCIGQAIWQELKKDIDLHKEENRASSDPNHILNRATMGTETILKQAQMICNEYVRLSFSSESITLHHVLLVLLEHKELLDILMEWILCTEKVPDELPDEFHEKFHKKLNDIVHHLRPITIRSHNTRLFPILNQWAIDLMQLIKDKKEQGDVIDPLIGRLLYQDDELKFMNYVSRADCIYYSKKNSAVLLSDQGVGETVIAEGLARRLVEGILKVGTGAFSPLKAVWHCWWSGSGECWMQHASPESVISHVFNLDLVSLLASTACKSAYEQIVKMILDEIAEHKERGIRAIIFMDNLSQIAIGGYCGDGTDFQTYIEKDGALARQFSPIYICESTPDETVEILWGLKVPLQHFHKVAILDNALVAATTITTQFFTHKRLPDSAIDLINETCAQATLARSANSETVWKLQRSRVVLEMDICSLKREVDEEKQADSNTFTLNLDGFEKDSNPITAEMVAKTAMYYTFIPAAETLNPSEILNVADKLNTVVVGQPEAVEAVANMMHYMWVGLKNPRRPIASFLFGGPSGSGKVLLVKGLSKVALGQSGKLLCINASDYIEAHSLTCLRRMSGATLITMIHARLEELRKQLSLINLQLSVHDTVRNRLQFEAALHCVGCARWLDRLIRSEILEPLAKLLLKNDVPENKTVLLNFNEDIQKITVRLVEGEPTVTEPVPESPVPLLPSTYHSFDTDDEHHDWEDGSIDSHSADEQEDEHFCQSCQWAPLSLRPSGPPALSPQPQRLF
ncbi:hypothetical protein BDR07DRAFT_1480578 [Suillus spraguei]|nr:hypothetical protein BDR07DRAFT_1480578 [Suillus spraguei]